MSPKLTIMIALVILGVIFIIVFRKEILKLCLTLALLVVGICSILNAVFEFVTYYYDFWTEKWADKLGGIDRKPGTTIRYIARDTIVK